MDAYDLHEIRLVQESYNGSAVDGLSVAIGPVPSGKVWTILSANLWPSVAETRTVFFGITGRSGNNFAVTVPGAIALSSSIRYPLVSEGMEIKLGPGEYIVGYRDVATAGSTLYARIRFIESDVPYYSYEEPLKKVVRAWQKKGSIYRAGGGPTGPGGGGGGESSEGGGVGGGGEPVL